MYKNTTSIRNVYYRSESSLTFEEENICPYAAKISNQETTETVNIDSEPTTEIQGMLLNARTLKNL